MALAFPLLFPSCKEAWDFLKLQRERDTEAVDCAGCEMPGSEGVGKKH